MMNRRALFAVALVTIVTCVFFFLSDRIRVTELPVVARERPCNGSVRFDAACMNRTSVFHWRQWRSWENKNFLYKVYAPMQFQRLQPAGWAARFEWNIGGRPEHYGWTPRNCAYRDLECPFVPRTIFINPEQLQNFNDEILPCMPPEARFVVAIGDHDATTPKQIDFRYRSPMLRTEHWNAWLKDPRIVHLFVEHLDTVSPPSRVTPLPCGINPAEFEYAGYFADLVLQDVPESVPDFRERKLRVAFTNRKRVGAQWEERANVSDLCNSSWRGVCDHVSTSLQAYARTIKQYPFLLCVHGGGVDPNPNLWTALLHGVIPILRTFPGIHAYDGWPVVVVDGWDDATIDAQKLEQWRDKLAPHFEREDLRREVLRRLMNDFWFAKVQRQLDLAGVR